jgi:hypothetical protein
MLLPITLTGTAGVNPEDAGAAAGLLNTARQLGGAIGLAVLVTVAATATATATATAQATHAADHGTPLAALVHGYHVAFLVTAAVMLVAALAALALPAATSPARATSRLVLGGKSTEVPDSPRFDH